MMGLTGAITPLTTGLIYSHIQGNIYASGVNSGAAMQIRFGTGNAPPKGQSSTGTAVGSSPQFRSPTGTSALKFPFSLAAVFTGATGTSLWYDLALAATGATATVENFGLIAFEIGGGGPTGPTGPGPGFTYNILTAATGAFPIPAVNMQINVIRQTSTGATATTLTLPTGSLNLTVGVKDGGTNFSSNPATVVAPTGTVLIDGVTGTVGYVMNFPGQFNWFGFDGSQWDIL